MLGIIGAGNMGHALARGWADPVYATDGGSGRAKKLVAEVGGEALTSNAELVLRADTILLAHAPHQLESIAREVDAAGKLVISVLGPTPIEQLQRVYPKSRVVRAQPNTPVEIRRGVVCIAEGGEIAVDLFKRVAKVFVLPESQMQLAVATIGVTPAYIGVIVESMVDAASLNGLSPKLANEMFLATLAGTAELIGKYQGDTLFIRRQVASPGESTVRGLAALERCGLRHTFQEAMRVVLERLNQPYHG